MEQNGAGASNRSVGRTAGATRIATPKGDDPFNPRRADHTLACALRRDEVLPVQRGVYFDAWFPRQHCYYPSLPPRRLRMVDDLVDYRATMLVWSALGGGSLALPGGETPDKLELDRTPEVTGPARSLSVGILGSPNRSQRHLARTAKRLREILTINPKCPVSARVLSTPGQGRAGRNTDPGLVERRSVDRGFI